MPISRAALIAALLCGAATVAHAQNQTTTTTQDVGCSNITAPCVRAPVLAASIARSAGSIDWLPSLPTGGLAVGALPMAYGGSASATVGTSSGTLFAAGAYARAVLVCTLPSSTANVWLRLDGGTAAAATGVPVFAGGGCTTIGTAALPLPTGAVTAITDGASPQTVTLAGG